MSRLKLGVLGVALLALVGPVARADEPKRPVPDYDGRGNPDAKRGSWVLWIPRVVLAPVYFVNEYVLRRPLGAFVTTAERREWANSVEELFRFGPSDKNLLIPTALFDFGLLPSVGFYLALEDVGVDHNRVRLHAATWGPKWINVVGADRYAYDNGAGAVEARFEFKRSEDNPFYGIGPDVTDKTHSRFGLERVEGALGYERQLRGESILDLSAGIHRISFLSGSCCSDPSLDDRIAEGVVVAPPGYSDDYTALFAHAEVAIDTREPRPAPGSGFYLRAHGDSNQEVTPDRVWLAYGAAAGVALDLNGRQRVLHAQITADFVDPLQGAIVPFNELITNGPELMPGFIPGWIRGRSLATAQLGYRWPVWANLDGQVRLTAGNAFGARLGDFAVDKLRLSGDVGLTTAGVRDQGFEVLFGLGTETFEQGGGITSVRVTFGTRRGF